MHCAPARRRATWRALNRTAQLAVDASSEVRESYGAYRTAYDIARHYRDEIVPLRKTIADENVLRYNGMLIGVFELLADAREQIASVVQADRGAARVLARRCRAAGARSSASPSASQWARSRWKRHPLRAHLRAAH